MELNQKKKTQNTYEVWYTKCMPAGVKPCISIAFSCEQTPPRSQPSLQRREATTSPVSHIAHSQNTIKQARNRRTRTCSTTRTSEPLMPVLSRCRRYLPAFRNFSRFSMPCSFASSAHSPKAQSPPRAWENRDRGWRKQRTRGTTGNKQQQKEREVRKSCATRHDSVCQKE